MTMRHEKGHAIGEPGGVYEFDVKLRRLRGVKITDSKLYHEIEDALHALAARLRKRFQWIDTIELRGRSNGWLAIEDPEGRATRTQLQTINKMVEEELVKFQKKLRQKHGEESWSRNEGEVGADRHERGDNPRAGGGPPVPVWMRAAKRSIARGQQRRAHARGESSEEELEDKMKVLHEVWAQSSRALRLRALVAAYPSRDPGGWDVSRFDVRAAIKIVEFAEES